MSGKFYKLHLRSVSPVAPTTGCVLSSGGDIQNIEKLQWHSSKSQTCKENQPILNSDLNKQYMFSKNTAPSEPSQNYFIK